MANAKRIHWGKWIGFLVFLVAVAAAILMYLRANREQATEYQTATVTRGNLIQVVTATGQLDPVVNIQVGSQISGIIRKLYVDFNSVVKSNQVIAEIDPSTYQINVLKAQADLANAKANMSLALVQARRADSLYTNNLISASDHDTAQAQLEQAQAQVQSDEATLKNAQVQLSYCTIYAPVDGVVISRNVDVGQTVAASFNTPTIFVIANDLAKMQIDALVSEADIGGVATNQDVNFNVDAYPYRTFHGKVIQIRYGAVTNQNVINYDCVIEVHNDDFKLLPGMTANVSIITAERDNALKIPNAALRFRPPEAIAAEMKTNASLPSMAQGPRPGGGEARAGGPGGGGGAGPGGPRPSGGRGPGGEGGGPGRHPRGEHQLTRTAYVLPPKAAGEEASNVKPKAVSIKVGISDGINTEVIDGLQEGAEVVTGVLSTGNSGPGGPTASPFGGGFRRF